MPRRPLFEHTGLAAPAARMSHTSSDRERIQTRPTRQLNPDPTRSSATMIWTPPPWLGQDNNHCLLQLKSPAVDAVQVVAFLQFATAGLGAAVVLPEPEGAAVLAGQGGDDVDVALGVADTDPPRRLEVAVVGDTDRGDDLGGDVAPLLVGQDRVVGMVVDRAVPDRQVGQCPANPGGLFE